MRAGLKTRPRPRQLFIKYNQKNNQVKTFSISRDIWFRVEGVDRVFVGGTQEPAGDNTLEVRHTLRRPSSTSLVTPV